MSKSNSNYCEKRLHLFSGCLGVAYMWTKIHFIQSLCESSFINMFLNYLKDKPLPPLLDF